MMTDKELLAEVVHVVNLNPLGLLATVDEAGVPQVRWMNVAAVAGVHRLYTIAGRTSRKLAQIEKNPRVTWVFSAAHCQDVATLFGTAQVMDAPIVNQQVWGQLAAAARSYVMNSLSDDRNLEFVTIETIVHRAELLSPRLKLFVPQAVPLSEAPGDRQA